MSVRLRLLLLAWCVAVPSLAAAAWAIAATYQRERDSVEQTLRETTRALALVVDRELGRREAVAWTLAASPSLATGDLAAFHAEAREATARIGGWAVLFGAKGMVANTSVPFGAPLPRRAEARPLIQLGSDADLSDLFFGPATGKPLMAISVPVSKPGVDARGVSIVLLPEHLQKVLEDQKLPAGWMAAILDRKGTVVARQPEPQRWIGKPATSDLRERIKTDSAGLFSEISLNGIATRTFFSKAPGFGWTFVIGVPEPVLYANMRRSLLELGGVTLVLFALAAAGAAVAARKLLRPAAQLRAAAQALQSGTPVAYAPSGVLELDSAGSMLVAASAQLRDAHAEMQRRIAEAIEELAEKNRQLQESSRLKSEFMSNMSHELRTPLNAIIGFSELMKDGLAGDLSARQHGYLGHIFQSGQHLLALINDLLDLSKIEAGKLEIEFDAVDLDTLLPDCVAVVSGRAEAKRVRVQREMPGGALGRVEADRRRLRQILYNLLSNAIKFTPSGGHVTLRAQKVDRRRAQTALPGFEAGVHLPLPDSDFQAFVEISVVDTGIGIRSEDAPTLFTPFTQIAGPAMRSEEGTGLGLAMVRQLAELHGGTVAVTSEAGAGSCFTVWLPWREGAAAAAELADPPVPLRSARPLALVVEDDDQAAALMCTQLEAEGFRVHRAASAEAALALAPECVPDLITLDIVLPGMDGWGFLARVKDVPNWRDIPVVVVSVVADQGRGFSLGASLVLEKPINRDALAAGLATLGLAPDGGKAKAEFNDGRFIGEVRRALSRSGIRD